MHQLWLTFSCMCIPAGGKVLCRVPHEAAGLLLPEKVAALRVQRTLPLQGHTNDWGAKFEIWPSLVIQATWEARTVGWLYHLVNEVCGRHAGRRSTEEVKLLWQEEADCMQQQQQVQAATSSRPSEEIPNSARLSSQYCNCKIVKTPRNNQLKKRIKIFDLSTMIVQGAV